MSIKKCVGCKRNIENVDFAVVDLLDSNKKVCEFCIQIIENVAKESYRFVKFTISEWNPNI